MLRLLALALLLANLLYFTWTLGWLDAVVGVPAHGDREPQRLQRQLHPETVQVTPVDEPTAAAIATAAAPQAAPAASEAVAAASSPPASAAPAPTLAAASLPAPASAPGNPAPSASAAPDVKLVCVEAGPFDAGAVAEVETALRAAAPSASWTQRRVAGNGNGEWMIYMGPYPDDAWIERKKAELSRIRGGLSYEVVGPTPRFGRGISLGRFTSQGDADKRLDELRPRGIRTARVIQSADGPGRTVLRFAKADPALLERLAAVQWPAGHSGLTPCASPR